MRKSFCLTLCGAASLFLLCFSAWASESVGSELSEARQVAQYNYVIHILAMLLVGFGFLMVFVRRYGFGATTGTMVIFGICVTSYGLLSQASSTAPKAGSRQVRRVIRMN